MRIEFKYTPEAGSPRTWTFDAENPAWDLAYVAEVETGWAWEQFIQKLSQASHIALRALVYAFRKRDEPNLSINAVTVTIAEVDLNYLEPEPKPSPKKAAKGEGEA